MIVSTLGNLALYGRFYAVQGYRFYTLAHSPFDFSLRLYVDLLEGGGKPADWICLGSSIPVSGLVLGAAYSSTEGILD